MLCSLRKRPQSLFISWLFAHIIRSSLCQLLSASDRNCLYWLDAHFPGADAGLKSYSDSKDSSERVPILQELSAIFKYDNGNSVILVDDLRCFSDNNDIQYHDFDAHMNSLGERGKDCTRESIVGITLNQIMDLIPTNYNIQVINKSEGSLLLTPKHTSSVIAFCLLSYVCVLYIYPLSVYLIRNHRMSSAHLLGFPQLAALSN